MHAEFTKIKPFLHEFKLVNVPFTKEEILTEINSYEYKSWRSLLNRYITHNPSDAGPLVNQIVNFLISPEFQNQMLDVIASDPEFWGDYWREDPIKFKKYIEPVIELDIDEPGFYMTPHVDDRSMILVGMCHLVEQDDPLQSSYFYTSEEGDNPLRMKTGFCVGWLSANLHNTWHSGQNKSLTNRASLKFGTRLHFK